MIYKPLELPNPNEFIEIWNKLAIQNGLNGIFFVGQVVHMRELELVKEFKFDAINIVRLLYAEQMLQNKYYRFAKRFFKLPRFAKYKDAAKYFIGKEELEDNYLPTIIPNWDHSPRSKTNALILHDSTPEYFEQHFKQVIGELTKKSLNRQLAFIKSWNEWAEGNYLEPDLKYGKRYLDVIKNSLQ
jgi:hypothetical protein